jgi:Protein of unknown function (DUF4019)
MRIILSLVLLYVLAGCQSAPVTTTAGTPVGEAHAAALAWLAQIDAGDYKGSWDSADNFFRGQIAQQKWISRVGEARKPFGLVRVRSLSTAEYVHADHDVPPEGERVVVVFNTIFVHDAVATEIVTPMKGSDGLWRVIGYGFVPSGTDCVETSPQTFRCGGDNLLVGFNPEIVRAP